MEERKLTVNFNKSGSGSLTPKVTLPIKWLRDMGVTKEQREITVQYNEETQEIVIKKQK